MVRGPSNETVGASDLLPLTAFLDPKGVGEQVENLTKGVCQLAPAAVAECA